MGEQAGAGLDRLTAGGVRDGCSSSTRAYRETFGFPFLFAVKGATKHDVLGALEARLAGVARRRESTEALRQVCAAFGWRSAAVRRTATSAGADRGAVRQRLEAELLRQGRRDVYRLNRDGRAPAGASPVFGANVLMLVYGDAFWPTYTTGDNTGLIATDSMKNFIQRETLNFDGLRPRGVLPVPRRDVPRRPIRRSKGMQVSADEIPYAGLRRRAGVHARPGRSGRTARVELTRAAAGRERVRAPRLQAAAPRRQRVPGLRARRVHDAARPHESAAAHVARPRMALHRSRRGGSTADDACAPGAPDRARRVRDVRVRQHPAADLPDGHARCSPRSRRSPRCTSKRTTARGIRSPNAATRSASTPTRGRRTGASA